MHQPRNMGRANSYAEKRLSRNHLQKSLRKPFSHLPLCPWNYKVPIQPPKHLKTVVCPPNAERVQENNYENEILKLKKYGLVAMLKIRAGDFERLMELFPEKHPAILHSILTLCNNNFVKALDVLLKKKPLLKTTTMESVDDVVASNENEAMSIPTSETQNSPVSLKLGQSDLNLSSPRTLYKDFSNLKPIF